MIPIEQKAPPGDRTVAGFSLFHAEFAQIDARTVEELIKHPSR